MKKITKNTVLKIKLNTEEKCSKYGCGNSDCIFECNRTKAKYKTVSAIKVKDIIYWINDTDGDDTKDWADWAYNPSTPSPNNVFYRVTPHFMPHGHKVIAQSKQHLKGVPVIDLDFDIKSIRNKIQYILNKKIAEEITYIDAVYELEKLVINSKRY